MSPTSRTSLASEGPGRGFPARCPECGRIPNIVALSEDGSVLDHRAFVSSGGNVVPSDIFREEFEIWRRSNAVRWAMECGCGRSMTSCHRNSLIHRWNARSAVETT